MSGNPNQRPVYSIVIRPVKVTLLQPVSTALDSKALITGNSFSHTVNSTHNPNNRSRSKLSHAKFWSSGYSWVSLELCHWKVSSPSSDMWPPASTKLHRDYNVPATMSELHGFMPTNVPIHSVYKQVYTSTTTSITDLWNWRMICPVSDSNCGFQVVADCCQITGGDWFERRNPALQFYRVS